MTRLTVSSQTRQLTVAEAPDPVEAEAEGNKPLPRLEPDMRRRLRSLLNRLAAEADGWEQNPDAETQRWVRFDDDAGIAYRLRDEHPELATIEEFAAELVDDDGGLGF